MEHPFDWRKWRMTPKEYLDWRLDQIVKECVAGVVEAAAAIVNGNTPTTNRQN